MTCTPTLGPIIVDDYFAGWLLNELIGDVFFFFYKQQASCSDMCEHCEGVHTALAVSENFHANSPNKYIYIFFSESLHVSEDFSFHAEKGV